jgi:integration host factor subunit alpha
LSNPSTIRSASPSNNPILVDNVFELIKKSLESGDDVLISGFGKFMVKKKAQRRGRNPATGGDLTLDARRVVTFKCSPVLREKWVGRGRCGSPKGNRTPVFAVRGRYPRPLDDGTIKSLRDFI